jgi:hypothetical protein
MAAWGEALRAFFDETGTHNGHPLTAVAGFLFDDAGLDKFEADWQKRTADLEEPFHTVDCVHGRGQFEGWPEPVRLLLMHDLPEIIIQTRICGFISFVESNEYDQWCKENPRYVSWIGSAYTVCLMKCVETAGLVARQNQFEGDIDYVFESGCDKQQEASEFMLRLDKNPDLKAGLRVGKWGFSPKKTELALCAADFLCWQWQRNYVRVSFAMVQILEFDSDDMPSVLHLRAINMGPGEVSLRKALTVFHEHIFQSKRFGLLSTLDNYPLHGDTTRGYLGAGFPVKLAVGEEFRPT